MVAPVERRSQAQRRSETEHRVIEAATTLIAEKGSRAVSLADVGRQAGYSRGIVNHHFGSKQQLLEAVVLSSQQFEVRPTSGSGIDRLLDFVTAYVDNLAGRSTKVRAFLQLWAEALAADPVLEPLFAQRDGWFRDFLADLVDAGVKDGSLRPDADPDAVAVLLLGLLRGLGMQLLSKDTLPPLELVASTLVDVVRRGLAPHQPT